MILFSAIEFDDCKAAYNWHRGFASANDALFPRTEAQFELMVMNGSVWAATDGPGGDFLAQAYSSYDESSKECEIGGLMVAKRAQGRGVGGTIMRLALAHAILEESILEIEGAKIVAHVLKSNDEPRRIITEKLRFRHSKAVEIPQDMLPGLRADADGFVRGDEFEISLPETIESLAEWATDWHGRVEEDGSAYIDLRPGVTIADWAAALSDLHSKLVKD